MTRSILIYSESPHQSHPKEKKEENQVWPRWPWSQVQCLLWMVPTYDGGSERPTSRRLHRQHTAAPPPPVAAQWCAASIRCSVSHTTIPKLVAATLCGLRPFALPRSLIPPKSHAALVSFNQQHQPSLEAKLASSSSPSTIAVTACAAACAACAAAVAPYHRVRRWTTP